MVRLPSPFDMLRRILLVALITAVALATARLAFKTAPALSAESDSPPAVNSPHQVIENNELMKLLFDPLYVDLRNGLREEPKGSREWRRIYIATFSLAEITNLLHAREGEPYMGTPEWHAEVTKAREATVALGDAVKEMDYDLARTRYETLIETCNACHTRFEPDNATKVEVFIDANTGESEGQTPLL